MEQDHSSKVDPPVKSDTMKSTNTDYNTPPESPTMPNPLFKTMGESMEKPPVAPPRYFRILKLVNKSFLKITPFYIYLYIFINSIGINAKGKLFPLMLPLRSQMHQVLHL